MLFRNEWNQEYWLGCLKMHLESCGENSLLAANSKAEMIILK
jgi:hypothetical protein